MSSNVRKFLVTAPLFFPLAVAAEELTLTDQKITTDFFSCEDQGIDRLVLSGSVEFEHTQNEEPFSPLDNDKEILIKCEAIHFEDQSRIVSRSNLRFIVDGTLSGSVHVVSSRGFTGYDAPSRRIEDLSKHKAANGTIGLGGKNGENASSPPDHDHDGTRGQNGFMGNPGEHGVPGTNGLTGSTGADAGNIHITTNSVAEGTTVELVTRGGDGGAGGRGGRGEDGGIGGQGGQGGKGGDASITHTAERGGDGGQGGQGGAGGNGGPGGNGGEGGQGGLAFFYIVEEGGRLAEAGTFDVSGGLGGFPGIGGAPGLGGDGGPGGAPGLGGFPDDLDILTVVTMGTHRLIVGDDLEIEIHGEGDLGKVGEIGPRGPDGRPGPIGEWGAAGRRGQGGELFQGVVSLEDFTDYKKRLGF